MNVIKVVVTGGAREGRFPFQIETPGTRLAGPTNGLSATPLLEACRMLKGLGAAADDATVELWHPGAATWAMRTSVGYGYKMTVRDTNDRLLFGAHQPMSPEAIAARAGMAKEPLKSSGGTEMTPQAEKPAVGPTVRGETAFGVEPTGAKPAISPAAPPPRHTPPASQAGKGQGPVERAKPKSSPRKRKPAGSSGRRGRR